tara:strand:+ start:1103 stop:1375 length:273 start_codon:yes stop_codon:yes gene_type:complete
MDIVEDTSEIKDLGNEIKDLSNDIKELYRKIYVIDNKIDTINDKIDSIYQCNVLINTNMNKQQESNNFILQHINYINVWLYSFFNIFKKG